MGATRRKFLGSAARLAGASVVAGLVPGSGTAAVLQVPTVDKLVVTVVVDSNFDLFMRPAQVPRGAFIGC